MAAGDADWSVRGESMGEPACECLTWEMEDIDSRHRGRWRGRDGRGRVRGVLASVGGRLPVELRGILRDGLPPRGIATARRSPGGRVSERAAGSGVACDQSTRCPGGDQQVMPYSRSDRSGPAGAFCLARAVVNRRETRCCVVCRVRRVRARTAGLIGQAAQARWYDRRDVQRAFIDYWAVTRARSVLSDAECQERRR